jgi:hypothetical protein
LISPGRLELTEPLLGRRLAELGVDVAHEYARSGRGEHASGRLAMPIAAPVTIATLPSSMRPSSDLNSARRIIR